VSGVGEPRTIVLVRHGETVGESSVRYHGANDVALSAHGVEQMRRVATALRHEHFGRVLSSTLQRSTVAAQLIAPQREVESVPGFDEINFGTWEGLTAGEIAARDPQLFRRWREDPARFTFPGGDSVLSFRQRVTASLTAQLPDFPARTLIVVHKGVINAIIGHLLGEPPEQRRPEPIDLGSIHRVTNDGSGWVVAAANLTDHLAGEP